MVTPTFLLRPQQASAIFSPNPPKIDLSKMERKVEKKGNKKHQLFGQKCPPPMFKECFSFCHFLHLIFVFFPSYFLYLYFSSVTSSRLVFFFFLVHHFFFFHILIFFFFIFFSFVTSLSLSLSLCLSFFFHHLFWILVLNYFF